MIPSGNVVSVGGSSHHGGSAMEFKRSRSDSVTSAGSNGSAQRRGVTLDHHSMNAHRRPLEEFLTALRKGTDLMKHGRHGKPKVHYFRLAENDTHLTWRSAKGNQRGVVLTMVKQVVSGQATEIFKRHPMPQFARLSFSLIYKEEKDNELRTLDLTCKNEQEFHLWFWGIQAVMEQVCHLPTPISSPVQTVMGSPAGPFQSLSSHGPFSVAANSSGTSYQQSLQSDPQGMGGGIAMGRASGAMGVPAPVHVPGDCYVWGSSDPNSSGCKSAASTVPGWLNSSVPTLVDNTTHLDVCEVAVSLRHAALVTHRGEMYTWGHGTGGKLGLGNHQNADSPQRVYTLWGKSVKRVSCGDGCTAAITHDGELYTWGDGAGGNLGYGNTLRQFIPRQVEKGLGDYNIIQVSCGPYHTCAVSSGGRLFSWGDGLCGKLGHASSHNCTEPRQVSSLADQAVLHVSCGVWHTACIARPQQAQDQAGSVSYLEGPASGSISFEDSSGGGLLGATRGDLYTWGGEFTWVDQKKDKAGHVTTKRDSHKGCLGLGDADGRLTPTRVFGPWREGAIQQVETGLNLTVVLTSDGQCFQMGETGASGRVKWEGCKEPELVGGALLGFAVERISVGMQHVAAQASPLDKKTGLPQLGSEFSGLFMWGRGREGQLGVATYQDNSVPKMVDELKGRRVLQVACGGYHTLAVCAHDSMQQEQAEKQRGYKQKVMQLFSKPVTVDVPDSRQHSSGPNTAGSGGITPLDRVSDGSMSLINHGSNDLAVTPRKAAGDEHVSSSRNGRNAPKSTSTGSMMGLVRAAAAVRRSKKDGLVRRSADHRGEFGPGMRVSAGSKRYADSKVPQRLRLQAANSSETLGSKDGGKASSDVGGWAPERSRASQAESEMGSIVSAPDMYAEDSVLIEDLVAEADARERHWQSQVSGLQSKVEKLESLLQREMGHHQIASPTPRPVYDISPVGPGPLRQQSRYPLSPEDRQAPSSPSGRDVASEPRLPSDRRGSAMSRTQDLRSSEGRRPSFGQLSYAEMGERRETMSREQAAELRGYTDRASELRASPDSKAFTRRGSGMASEPDKADLDRERRQLRQERADLERRLADFDRRQNKLVAERRGSVTKNEGSNNGSPFKSERGMSQQSSSDLDKSLMQMGSRQSSGGSQAGPRQGPLSNEGGAARGKGHRRTASSGQGTATTGDSGPEWTEEVDQGVFLTFAKLSNGQNSLTRIRFNRQHFDKAAASVWWQNNKSEMGLRYNIASNSGTPTGLHTPNSEPATNAGLSPPHHRLWTVSHSSEHLEGMSSMPSRLNPSKFAPSPTSSPNRVPPLQPYQGPASSLTPGQTPSFQEWVPTQMLTQADSQASPYLAGYSQDSQDQEPLQQQSHLAWNGLQNPESPFSNRDASLAGWRGSQQNNASSSLAANQMPRHGLDLIPETSERSMSLRPLSSNVASTASYNIPEPLSKTSAPAAVTAGQPQTYQQTNGASHTSGWTHHSSIMQAYQPEA
ncbi:TPA: hypothetical protein ACH3X2_004351 [Trebouxia sp. C0005]